MVQYKMFGFIKKCLLVATTLFGCNVLRVNPLNCVSMNNQKSKIRTKIIDINKNELFYLYSIKVNKLVVDLIILIIHMLNYVFLTLLKT